MGDSANMRTSERKIISGEWRWMNSFIKGVEVARRGMRPFTFQNAKLAGGGGAVAGGASDITLTQQA